MKTIGPVRQTARLLLLALLLMLAAPSRAGVTDIATAPLATAPNVSVLPNLLFVLDDSASMDNDSLPDWANDAYCRKTNGEYTAPCCRDGTGADGDKRNGPCWRDVAAGSKEPKPFGTWRGHPPYLTSDFNSLYYNPAITYAPPVNGDGTRKPNQTTYTSVATDAYGLQNAAPINLLTEFPDTEWCTDASASDCLTNGNYILPGRVNDKNYMSFRATKATGSRSVVNGTPAAPVIESGRKLGPHYYSMLPGEYCDNIDLRNCQSTHSAMFSFPAPLRWCSTTANAAASAPESGSCQAVKTPAYPYPRYPTRFFSAAIPGSAEVPAVSASTTFTVTLAGCTSGKKVALQAVSANTENLLSKPTELRNTADNLAADIRSRINDKNGASGYRASGSNNTVTITASYEAGNVGYPVSIARASGSSSGCTASISPAEPKFSGYRMGVAAVPATPASYAGSFIRTDIVPESHSYAYPGTGAKAPSRTDCAGKTCTYDEEMTNFANWWAYYHTRMQAAKSAASISFAGIGARYRVGYFTINKPADAANALKVGTFDAAHKSAWYSKLFAASPNNTTPLHEALTRAGRIFAGKITDTPGADPVQYSCQQNFTILMTDGEWSLNRPGKQIDGATVIGDMDSADTRPRPEYDGNATAGTLADVTAYYYDTDLRTEALGNCTGSAVAPATVGNDVCKDNVPSGGSDTAKHQHMTTFTVGFGITGYMQFSADYASGGSGDFLSVKNGVAANPAAGVCTWQTSGVCNWAAPTGTPGKLDDVWHAAVNGHGRYVSAGDPAALALGLSNALLGVGANIGSAAAATSSNPNIVDGDNFLFSSSYMPKNWYGELIREEIDISTGAVSSANSWSAKSLLDTNGARTIYTFDPNAAGRLKIFNWANLSSPEKNHFKSPAINDLTQFCSSGATCLGKAAQDLAAGENLVAYLAGDRTNEGSATDISKFYRQRTHLLGDIVNSEAVYVKAPLYTYADAGYDTFKAAMGGRQGMVYVAANDGMLHGFNASTGVEQWAYVPSLALLGMFRLADKNYDALHTFQVDGSPNQGDVFHSGAWHTILVGGMNRGGRGYYALDITDPAAPKALWEFMSGAGQAGGHTTDADLGYTYGKPEITKLANGTWVVLVTSGLNNVKQSPGESGDGKGYLYVLNAMTGELIRKIPTGAGSTDTPSGLTQIRAWADNTMFNNTAQRVYGGDMQGNLWRFDINGNVGPAGYDAFLLATLRDGAGNAQPLTARPELGDVNGYPMVYVGTGRYLGVTDLSDASVQSIYAIKDTLSATAGYGNPRSLAGFVKQTLTRVDCPANSSVCSGSELAMTGTSEAVNLASDSGWYVDLPGSGERANTDPQLALGTLSFTTNIPDATACTAGGYSNIYYFDYRSGAPVSTSSNAVAGKQLGNSLATRPVLARLPNNNVIAFVRMSDGSTLVPNVPVGTVGNRTRRLSWRILINEN